jgi:hypothetical protein
MSATNESKRITKLRKSNNKSTRQHDNCIRPNRSAIPRREKVDVGSTASFKRIKICF